jgi:hypothetical protein
MLRVPLLIGLAILTSCQSGFQAAWEDAAQKPSNHPLVGRWSGEWKSRANGHSGALRCVIVPRQAERTPSGEQDMDFYYHAKWAKVLSASYHHVAQVTPLAAGKWRITGSKDLGQAVGGVFSHEGVATENTFQSNYRALGDVGSFELKRFSP